MSRRRLRFRYRLPEARRLIHYIRRHRGYRVAVLVRVDQLGYDFLYARLDAMTRHHRLYRRKKR